MAAVASEACSASPTTVNALMDDRESLFAYQAQICPEIR